MKKTNQHKSAMLITLIFCLCAASVSFEWESAKAYWESTKVYYNGSSLAYATDSDGVRIPDFSYVGYKYGEDLPTVPVVHTISPVSGDNTSHIQAAIDYVGGRSKDANGFRGTLLLNPGTYSTDDILYVPYDGVVIRGSGKGDDPKVNTIISSTRTGTDDCVFGLGLTRTVGKAFEDAGWTEEVAGSRVDITDAAIPIGDRSFNVTDASGFDVGDHVVVIHVPKPAWFPAVDDGGTDADAPWSELDHDFTIPYSRYITGINGNEITVDAPFFYTLKSSLADLHVYKYDTEAATGQLYYQVGIENLRIDILTNGGEDEDHTYSAVNIMGVVNGWARDLHLKHFKYAGVDIRKSLYITVRDCYAGPPVSIIKGSRRDNFNFSAGAQNALFINNTATDCRHGFSSNGRQMGSGAVVIGHHLVRNITGSEAGHMFWSQGVLFDNCTVTSVVNKDDRTYVAFNRGDFGTSHGWGGVNSVIWNTDTSVGGKIVVQKPPTAQNYAIGCSGNVTGDSGPTGFIEGTGHGSTLYPQSLYAAQLADRLGSTPPPKP